MSVSFSVIESSCHTPSSVGAFDDLRDGLGHVDLGLPVTDPHLDVAPGVEVGPVQVLLDQVERTVDVSTTAIRSVARQAAAPVA